jgi:hypothetical protein
VPSLSSNCWSSSASSASPAGFTALISQVEFFQDTNSLGVVVQFPYELILTNTGAGVFRFQAQATDSYGVKASSSEAHVALAEPPRILSVQSGTGSRQVEVSGTSGIPLVLERSPDLTGWLAVETNAPVAGVARFTDTTNEAAQFYRVALRTTAY